MGFRLPGSKKTIFAVSEASSKAVNAPKGYLAVYVGEKMKRLMIPVSYLNQPSFQDLLSRAEEEFGYEPHNSLQRRSLQPYNFLLEWMISLTFQEIDLE
ncbi:auxin-induced protein 6B-like [Vigna unguiculata]|uniref:SAUR family protein n=1 Tax=Vigna unguiculata TaxID=3917 RepID=A0A4D6MV65_VIGUN|nr:auxin-induced protein 6B-like [Vigna unguiculata]XP_027934487.1 auxin-induced protein 6B-like [Vigna unguiculata]QCE05356.1 SAUR family protein [Vigna unguiculata]